MTTGKPDPPTPAKPASTIARADRLAEALRANLQKRKAQSRARRAGEEDMRADGITTTVTPDEG